MNIINRYATDKNASVLFWIILIVFWFATLGQRALIHPDEGRYAELSLGMLQSGDWITPRLNGILYFEKPALQYWMGALSFLAFGINEFAARFWPGLTGILSVLAVWLTSRRVWDHGHLAALVLAGSFWVIGPCLCSHSSVCRIPNCRLIFCPRFLPWPCCLGKHWRRPRPQS